VKPREDFNMDTDMAPMSPADIDCIIMILPVLVSGKRWLSCDVLPPTKKKDDFKKKNQARKKK
jgi:hypothetical protein